MKPTRPDLNGFVITSTLPKEIESMRSLKDTFDEKINLNLYVRGRAGQFQISQEHVAVITDTITQQRIKPGQALLSKESSKSYLHA